MKKILSIFFVAFSVVSVVVVVSFLRWLQQPLAIPDSGLNYKLDAGASVGHVAYDLSRIKVLKSPGLLTLYARLSGQTSVKVGEYTLSAGTTPQDLLQQLVAGDVVRYSLTLVEGWNYAQALEYLHKQPKLIHRLQGLNWKQQKKLLQLELAHPEGWFFPDTYHYVSGRSDVDILRRAHTAMKTELAIQWQNRAVDLPYKNAYEALIMASIVERETGAPSEREQIAGVFVRRLQKGMRLQTDPTVIYGMGDRYHGNIRRADLRRPTPYNTYTIKGLPPTPIALAGREAIRAALHPDSGNTLYFVAKGNGRHQFSTTLQQHNAAVQAYQLRRRANYRSAPSG